MDWQVRSITRSLPAPPPEMSRFPAPTADAPPTIFSSGGFLCSYPSPAVQEFFHAHPRPAFFQPLIGLLVHRFLHQRFLNEFPRFIERRGGLPVRLPLG